MLEAPKGKYFQRARLVLGEKPGAFRWEAGGDPDSHWVLRGALNKKGHLVLEGAQAPVTGKPSRITLRFAAKGKRLILLLEGVQQGSTRLGRLAKVGYTRKGSGFARGAQRECIITGGAGTIPVTYQGKTYYVCCSGCKELFEEDPSGELAAYRERLRQEAAEEAAKKKKP